MTTPSDFTKNTGWVHINNNKYPRELFVWPLNIHRRTSTLQRPSKRLNPLQAYLFDLSPTAILTDIEIWVSVLEYYNKYKHVLSRFKPMCNPIIFASPHDLWAPDHNFGSFCWYNEQHYKWVHRRIFAKHTGP